MLPVYIDTIEILSFRCKTTTIHFATHVSKNIFSNNIQTIMKTDKT